MAAPRQRTLDIHSITGGGPRARCTLTHTRARLGKEQRRAWPIHFRASLATEAERRRERVWGRRWSHLEYTAGVHLQVFDERGKRWPFHDDDSSCICSNDSESQRVNPPERPARSLGVLPSLAPQVSRRLGIGSPLPPPPLGEAKACGGGRGGGRLGGGGWRGAAPRDAKPLRQQYEMMWSPKQSSGPRGAGAGATPAPSCPAANATRRCFPFSPPRPGKYGVRGGGPAAQMHRRADARGHTCALGSPYG